MKGLKNLAIFLAGGLTVLYVLKEGHKMDAEAPREGRIIFENDEIRVIRATSNPAKDWNVATVVYKNKD